MSWIRAYSPHVTIGALALIGVMFPGQMTAQVQGWARWFLIQFDWLTLLVASAAVVFCIVLACLPVGARRIGGDDAVPEFRTVTWLAMLFAAGMGTGLVFWGAAEPLIHTISPPPDSLVEDAQAARMEALAITQFHWSIHAWSVYAVAALAVAIGTARKRPPLPSAPFPGMPKRARRLIDWVALFAVIFGVVASLGQGAFQMGAGLERLSTGQLQDGPLLQVLILIVLTVAFLSSAAAGLRKGIAVLSNINMVLATVLALFVFITGPTGEILRTMGESLTAYGRDFFSLSTGLRAEGAARQWTRDWSLTYFLWWIAWTPFVGAFIARISRGRRIRDFVLGVVFVPSLVTLVWFSIFGGAALSLHEVGIDLGVSDFKTAPAATYSVLEHLPLTFLAQLVTFLLVFIFLLTSADSGAFVLSMFSTGTGDPPVTERLFWGLVLSIITAASVLSAEGQSATRAFAVSGAIPLVILLMAQAGSVIATRGYPPKAKRKK